MTYRHLLPDEIDLLLDGEVGFGVGPLKAHVRDCADCRARLDEARLVVDAIEHLPHFAPSHSFANAVMAQVHVFVPWHVALRDSAQQWLPQSRSARLAVGSIATALATVITVALVWIATQGDALVFASGLVSDRVRMLVSQAAREAITTVLGDQAFAAIHQAGTLGITVAVVGFLGGAIAALAGLRSIAASASRRRG